jgi:hypothetical protein
VRMRLRWRRTVGNIKPIQYVGKLSKNFTGIS